MLNCSKTAKALFFSFSVHKTNIYLVTNSISCFLLNPHFVKVGIHVLVLKSISKTQWMFCVGVWHSSWRQQKILCLKNVTPAWVPGSDFEKVLVDILYDSVEHSYQCLVGQQSHRKNQTHVSWSPLLQIQDFIICKCFKCESYFVSSQKHLSTAQRNHLYHASCLM